ncbi:ATP-binding protein [Sphaerisporangium sp. NPDC051011]|uniref:ATP-binding protein n=1 Tax=Sphaerisporangium sp. NPDC051011 TaxID=3155792 RepID=UPI003404D27B
MSGSQESLPFEELRDLATTRVEAPDDEARYTMRISRLTIDKLGIKLYDRVSAVLAELIANAYDADAEEVTVTLPWGRFLTATTADTEPVNFEIVISDDGHGMTKKEVNRHYLAVGSDRRIRTQSDRSFKKERRVMGRKGIGKLAPFGICQTVEVISVGGIEAKETDEGWPVAHLILRLPKMLYDTDKDYHPDPGPLDGTRSKDKGTKVILRDFARKRVPAGADLNRQLAARFGLQRDDWKVTVVNSLDPNDSFVLGELAVDFLPGTKIDVADVPVPYEDKHLPVSGWVAYSKQPYKDEAMAGVRIFARGKLVAQTRDFGIGAGFTGEFKLRSYLVGHINAEWLDEREDLVRSDRQDIIWSSDLGEALRKWGQKLIKDLASRGQDSLRQRVWDEFLTASELDAKLEEVAPQDKEFRDSVRQAAKLLVDNKDREAINDPDHVERVVKLAFSLGPHRSLLDALHDAADGSETTLDAVVELFEKARIAEMYSLGQVASERIGALSRLELLVADAATLEGPLQELIEQAPWLLAPEWTPLGMNESLKRVRSSFEAWYKKKHGREIVTSAINRERKEPDFVMLHDAGALWIVEIKRLNYSLTDPEYLRAVNYLDDLEMFLEENPQIGGQFPLRRLTLVVDRIDNLNSTSRSSLQTDPRIDRRTWHELLDSTKRAHKDFLTRVEEIRVGPRTEDPAMIDE